MRSPVLACSISSLNLPSQSSTGARLEINHSVLIKILKPAEVNTIVEPMVPEIDVSAL